jgi:hypothetical protein
MVQSSAKYSSLYHQVCSYDIQWVAEEGSNTKQTCTLYKCKNLEMQAFVSFILKILMSVTVIVAVSRNCVVNCDVTLVCFINNMSVKFVVISDTGFIVLKVCFRKLNVSIGY